MDALAPNSAERLTASRARQLIRAGQLSPLALTQACLARIAARDQQVRAWIAINPQAETQAAAISPDDPRPLAGIPIAVKDIIDTADLPTTHNSPLYSTNRPTADAPSIELLRNAGAIILGKVDTSEFAAGGRQAATVNPTDLTRTPGGSSSGSAAAVADFHVPLALGSQTGGSTIRPAAFCGNIALKPSWGLISTEGVKRYAVSFDTVGLFARSIDDLDLLADVYNLPPAPAAPDGRLRLGLCRTPYFDQALPETQALFDSLETLLAPVADLIPFDPPSGFETADDLHRCVMHCEGASAFLNLARGRPTLLHDDFHNRVELRQGYSQREHFEAYDSLALMRIELETRMQGFDAILVPSAPGHAPAYANGVRPKENPVFNACWTAMQVPVLNLPVMAADDVLPLGVSLIAPRAHDRRLLGLGQRLAGLLDRR
ncbi:amidase [Pseudooceanicola sp.]|uniref:amidase n=1 Tax=Pseudooceanicola sp. TaxID=1914328 RepID=UPI002615B00B|nr:amidase [Pseudooceanicola sp.]MDF1857026.1 amidase [Pseudooceanicola sp.]